MNFNPKTGEKLNAVCENCWIKHTPYDCGCKECPGYRLYVIEAQKKHPTEIFFRRAHLEP